MTRALLLSAYHAQSHARWARGLVDTLDELDWTVVTLPPRHFKWRIRGNAWWWALEEQAVRQEYEVVVATSMVDFAALIGLAPHLGRARKIVYFHENQFAYPTQDGEFDMHLGAANVYAALAADVIVFNTAYNRDTMLDGVRWMCATLPDFAPRRTADVIAERSEVIPVGLEDAWYSGERSPRGPLQIVWNHRWEYDKAPERLFAALELLDCDFTVHVVGEQFRSVPESFARGREMLGDRVGTWGFVSSVDEYRALLGRCDVVVSTALHEFQGLAVLEAMAAGCATAVPDRLSYRELVPDHGRYASHVDDPAREATKLARHLCALAGRLDELRAAPAADVEHLRWRALGPRWRQLIS